MIRESLLFSRKTINACAFFLKMIKKILENCPPYLHRIVDCALNTGMRRGEILGLKWSQIRNCFIYLRETKTSESRQIPINDTLKLVFNQIKSEQNPKGKKVIGLDGKPVRAQNSKYVFTYKGEPVKNVKKSFKTALLDMPILPRSTKRKRSTF